MSSPIKARWGPAKCYSLERAVYLELPPFVPQEAIAVREAVNHGRTR